VLDLAATACERAIYDAGLQPLDIDGVICYHLNDSALVRDVQSVLGLREITWWNDIWGGGPASCAVVAEAALVVAAGLAKHIVVYRAMRGRSGVRMGRFATEEASGVHQFMTPHGFGSPPQIFAMFARRYMATYGITKEQMGYVAVIERQHAMLNERAVRRDPITLSDYLSSPPIAEPFNLLDCCQETDAGCAVVVSRADIAQHLRHPVVEILGFQYGANRGSRLPLDRLEDFTDSCFRRLGPALYRQSGVPPDEVDVAELYDAFTIEVIHQLEQLGICEPGEGGAFVAEGRIAIGSNLPVNTHGGLLSEGYVHGLNHVVEAVEQLRGGSGKRQVLGAQTALVTGYSFGSGSMLMLRSRR